MSSTPAFNASLALVTTTNLNNGPDAACKKKAREKKFLSSTLQCSYNIFIACN